MVTGREAYTYPSLGGFEVNAREAQCRVGARKGRKPTVISVEYKRNSTIAQEK